MNELVKRTLSQQIDGLKNGEFSAKELTQAYLTQIEEKEKDIGAYISIFPEQALAAAEAVDQKRAAGQPLSLLAGIPAGIKDNICTRNIRTTCASKMLGEYVPPYDADVIERLKKNDYVLLGKLNMDEFAMGSSCENSAFHPTHNPADLTRVPGGSSGGSAAAVAAMEAAYSLGSDTGGSIRQPASFCGVVGMKPTYGSVSRYGLIAFASSLDQIGPLTRTVEDNAIVLNAISGHDKRDATSLARQTADFTADIGKGVKDLSIGIPKEFFAEGIAPEVKNAVLNAAGIFEKMGAQLHEVSMPSIPHALSAYYIISSAEASSNLARFDGIRYGYRAKDFDDITDLYLSSRSEGFGKEVKRRIMLGTFALSSGYYDAYYKKAQQVRSLVTADFNRVFESCDVILSPVAPTPAYKIGEKSADPLEMYMGDAYSVPVNIAGVPALSLPCGTTETGLPIGCQLIGKVFSESLLYRVGAALENARKERM